VHSANERTRFRSLVDFCRASAHFAMQMSCFNHCEVCLNVCLSIAPTAAVKWWAGKKLCDFQKVVFSRKRCETEPRLPLITNRKSHMRAFDRYRNHRPWIQTRTRIFRTCIFSPPLRKLIRQTINFNLHDFYARTLSHAVNYLSFLCDVKPATIDKHLLMIRSTEYRKVLQNGLNKVAYT